MSFHSSNSFYNPPPTPTPSRWKSIIPLFTIITLTTIALYLLTSSSLDPHLPQGDGSPGSGGKLPSKAGTASVYDPLASDRSAAGGPPKAASLETTQGRDGGRQRLPVGGPRDIGDDGHIRVLQDEVETLRSQLQKSRVQVSDLDGQLKEAQKQARAKSKEAGLVAARQKMDLEDALEALQEARARIAELEAKVEAAAAVPEVPYVEKNVGDAVPWDERSWRERVGVATWTFLHAVAARYPDKPTPEYKTAALGLLRSLQYLYPCDSCRNSLNRNLRRVAGLWPPHVDSRASLSLWLCRLHNQVNTQLSKQLMPCSLTRLDAIHLAECDECLEGEERAPDDIAALDDGGAPSLVEDRVLLEGGADSNVEAAKQASREQRQQQLARQQEARMRGANVPAGLVGSGAGGMGGGGGGMGSMGGGAAGGGSNGCDYKVERWFQGYHRMDPGALNLVVFFSPTCHVCKEYMPGVVQDAFTSWSARGLNLVAIADVTAESESLLRQFIDDASISYPVAIAPFEESGYPYETFIGRYRGQPAALEIDPVTCKPRNQFWGFRIEQLGSFLEKRLGDSN